MSKNRSAKIRAPLKWAGGKYQILDHVLPKLPSGNRLIEPFVGSGAVFLNAEKAYKRLYINDINQDLILFYKTLKKEKENFINYAKKFFTEKNNTPERYYRFREEFNTTKDPQKKAALFLYINKHGYNGLCRYNASGNINVPFGRYAKPYFPRNELEFFIKISNKIRIDKKDFEKVFDAAEYGDIIYCDPPYVPLSKTSNFTTYSAGGFRPKDQFRLAEQAKAAAKRGIPVIISNHKTELTLEIYSDAELHDFSVRRLISCNGSKREMANELIAIYR